MSGALQGRTAIVYGAGGGIGSAISAAFAAEGAHVCMAGRGRESLEAAAAAVPGAEIAVFDALDEAAVDAHAADVARRTGRIDVSFNLISRGDAQGTPLVQMQVADLMRAVDNGLRSNFLTARAAGRVMATQGSGVILHLNSASGPGAFPGMGSTGPADAATEAMFRYLAAELGPSGVRVCGIWTAGVAETFSREKFADVAGDQAPDLSEAEKMIASMSALRRTPRLADVTAAAVFLASDAASGITGSVTNVTAGLVVR